MLIIKFYRWLNLSNRPLVLEATALPTESDQWSNVIISKASERYLIWIQHHPKWLKNEYKKIYQKWYKVTRSGNFLQFLGSNFLRKISQILSDILGNFKWQQSKVKKCCGKLWKHILAIFYCNIWSHCWQAMLFRFKVQLLRVV